MDSWKNLIRQKTSPEKPDGNDYIWKWRALHTINRRGGPALYPLQHYVSCMYACMYMQAIDTVHQSVIASYKLLGTGTGILHYHYYEHLHNIRAYNQTWPSLRSVKLYTLGLNTDAPTINL